MTKTKSVTCNALTGLMLLAIGVVCGACSKENNINNTTNTTNNNTTEQNKNCDDSCATITENTDNGAFDGSCEQDLEGNTPEERCVATCKQFISCAAFETFLSCAVDHASDQWGCYNQSGYRYSVPNSVCDNDLTNAAGCFGGE